MNVKLDTQDNAISLKLGDYFFLKFSRNPGTFWSHSDHVLLTRPEVERLADALNHFLNDRRSGNDRRING